VDTIRANGVDFSYLSKGSGPLVLLLHGFPDTAHTWDRAIDEIAAAGYRAVAPNLRGYHPTGFAPDGKYDTDTLGRDALALIEALGHERAIVVGHDWGAGAAIAAAVHGPERVRLLVTVAIPHPRAMKPTPKLAWTLRHFLSLRRKGAGAKIRAKNFALVDELWHRWSPAWKNIPASETAQVKAAFANAGCAEAACSYYATVGIKLPPSHLTNIKVPSVAFAGEHDMVAPRSYEKARHCYDASYEVVLVPGGHFMHREHPEHFCRELVRTLKDHEARLAPA
jgi:pimeloyl-ACP methyl ester carboxylesterase